MSMRALAIRGSLWTLGGYGLSQIIRLGSHLILAWLLAPEIFGLMALVKVFMQGMEMFSDVGIKPSIIHSKRGHDPAFLNTAWTIQIVRGFALWICTCLLAWPVAAMFARNDEAAWALVYLLPVAGFGTVIAGFSSTALATLNKDLRLGRLTTLEIASQIVSLMVMVLWALLSPSVWAMVAGGLMGGCFKMIASHFIVPGHRLRVAWDRESASELFRFGQWVFLSTMFTFLAHNLDRIVLGNLLSLTDLGLYSIAFTFAGTILSVSMRLSGTVLFPIYSRFRDDASRMLAVALEAREMVLWIGATTCLSFCLIAPMFFATLWDSRYHTAGFTAQWISIYVWINILHKSIGNVPLALGNSKSIFIANVVKTIGIPIAVAGYLLSGLPAFIVGLSFGPLASHVYLINILPVGRRLVAVQSILFSLVGLMYGIPALGLCRALVTRPSTWAWTAATIVLAVTPLFIGMVAVLRILHSRSGGMRIPKCATSGTVGTLHG